MSSLMLSSTLVFPMRKAALISSLRSDRVLLIVMFLEEVEHLAGDSTFIELTASCVMPCVSHVIWVPHTLGKEGLVVQLEHVMR